MTGKVKILGGCGYHPSHLALSNSAEYIPVPNNIGFIEMGLAEFSRHCDNSIYEGQKISLHLARSPICEGESTQDEFTAFLKTKILSNKNKISSIGLHLTGSRNEGIGKLGFSSHFKFSEENENNAIHFITKLKKDIGVPVWIENANFYSSSALEVIQNWESARKILSAADAHLIFDLTHCYIECRNLGLNPEFVFGQVPWSRVVEIHVSGYVTGNDGALHDGHSQPVNKEIWSLLKFVLERFITSDEVIINIEHTDLSWKTKRDDYKQEFKILNDLQFSAKNDSAFSKKQIDYAISNINRIMSLRHPEIQQLLTEYGYEQKAVLHKWIQEFMQGQLRLVFSKNEVPEAEFENTVVVVDGFTDYIRKNLV